MKHWERRLWKKVQRGVEQEVEAFHLMQKLDPGYIHPQSITRPQQGSCVVTMDCGDTYHLPLHFIAHMPRDFEILLVGRQNGVPTAGDHLMPFDAEVLAAQRRRREAT